jgi:dUTP pyrophosphatase
LKKNNGGRSSLEIKIKKLNSTAIIPTRGSAYAAGYDLYSNNSESITINAHETVKIGTGLSIEVPEGYFGGIFARSGLATRNGLRPANCVGVGDSDFRGEYVVALHNDSNVPYTVQPNERIAQLVVIPYLHYDFIEVDELTDTERGSNGFGSTGK